MEKPKFYFYACVNQVDMVYMGPDHRRERWSGIQPPIVQHSRRFMPEDLERDPPKPADVLVTEKPLANYFVEPQVKKVRRKNLRTSEWETREKTTKVAFSLLEPEEITESVRKRAIGLNLRDLDYAEPKKVTI